MTSPYASGGNVTADNLQRVQIREAERQTALLKSIRNGVSLMTIMLLALLLLLAILAAS